LRIERQWYIRYNECGKKEWIFQAAGERRETYLAEIGCQRALSVDYEGFSTSLVAQEVRETPQRGESAKVEVPSGYGRVEGWIGSA
jgi:hypothetical protein